MWANAFLGVTVAVLLFAGLAIIPQTGRPYPENAFWQAIIVLLTGCGWILGIVPAGMAARRGGWWIVGVYLLAGAGSFALVWLGTDRQAGAIARTGALVAGLGAPLAMGVLLRLLSRM